MEKEKIYLTELIDVKVLQRIQDGFSAYTGMAALTTDADGIPVTKGSGFTEFCTKLTRKSLLGFKRCAECDRRGALQTLITGEPAVYHCHAGLVDYAAPIMVKDCFIGSFIGGQVRTGEINKEKMKKIAEELGIDPATYISMAEKATVLSEDNVKKSAVFLSEIAKILSEMAYRSYKEFEKNKKMEMASRSNASFLMNMSLTTKKIMKELVHIANNSMGSEDVSLIKRNLKNISHKGVGVLSTIEDTIEYIRMVGGKIEITEFEYQVRELFEELVSNVESYVNTDTIQIKLDIQKNVPEWLLGDANQIVQVVNKLLLNSFRFMDNGTISINISCEKISYATMLKIEVKDMGVGMTESQLDDARQRLNSSDEYIHTKKEDLNLGFYVIGLIVKRMAGTIEVTSKLNEGSLFTVTIPQLEVKN